jgi:hypothetical protein
MLEMRCLLAVEALPAAQPLEPEGSLLYGSSVEADIQQTGEVDLYTVELQIGQIVSLIAESDATLQLSLFLVGPDEQLIDSSIADSVGHSVFLQMPAIRQSGTHTVAVSGVGGMGGDYSLQLILNGGVDEGSDNESQETAQDLTSTFMALGGAAADRGAVVGSWPSDNLGLVASEGFESGSLGARWATNSSTANGRIQVTAQFGARAGFLALFMDTDNAGEVNLNEAVWTVNLSPANQFTLGFSHLSRDIVQPLPADFEGSADGDGVSISTDGVHWYTVVVPPRESAAWRDYEVDLTAAAEAHKLELGPGFQIKFQQYGDSVPPFDGSGFDQITITQEFTGYSDWYRFSIDDGQSTSLVLSGRAAGTIELDLFNSDGNHLATGVAANNAAQIINNYVDPTDDGQPNAYFARARGWGGNYSLVVTRDTDFDAEDNDGLFDESQDINVTGLVAGAVAAKSVLDEPVTFAVIGDWGSQSRSTDLVADMITDTNWDVDFIVTTGDNNYGLIDETDGDWEAIVGARYGDYVLGRTDNKYPLQTSEVQRFFPSVGNHDGTASGFGQTGESGGIIPGYVDYFVTDPEVGPRLGPGNGYHGQDQSYYDVRWGPIHLFAVDSDHARVDSESLEAQQTWLETTARQSDALWKFAFFHHSPFSSSTVHGNNAPLQWDFAAWGIDAVFGGHDHTYERIVGPEDGQLYFVSGLGGQFKYPLGFPIPGSQIGYNEDFGAMRVTVNATNVAFEFLSVDDGANGAHGGRLIDRYTLQKDVDPADYYRFAVSDGDLLSVTVQPTEAIGLANGLDVLVELYDSTGELVALDRDGSIEHVATVSGTYSARVVAEASSGEYLLSVSGNTGERPAFEVAAPSPANGLSFNSEAGVQVEFNQQVLLSTIDTDDLKFDGIAAESVTAVNGRALRFGVPSDLAEGLVTITIADGAMLDLQGRSVASFSAEIAFDQTRPIVTNVLRNDGRDLPDRIDSLTFQFSEDVSSEHDVGDLRIIDVANNLKVDTVGVTLDATTGRFDVSSLMLSAGEYIFELISHGVRDEAGNMLDGNVDDDVDNYRTTQSIGLSGDANDDGVVDGQDFSVWFTHRFTGDDNNWEQADFDDDGVTDGADFNIWLAHRFVMEQGVIAAGQGANGRDRGAPRAPLQTLPFSSVSSKSLSKNRARRESPDPAESTDRRFPSAPGDLRSGEWLAGETGHSDVRIVLHDERPPTQFELARWSYEVRQHSASSNGLSTNTALGDVTVMDAALRTELRWNGGNAMDD